MTDELETRNIIFNQSFDIAVMELKNQLGNDLSMWKWGRVHYVEHPHPLAVVKLFAKIFNVGPIPINGGEEVLNNVGFKLTPTGTYRSVYGPAIRRIIDYSDVAHSFNVQPTGNSGMLMSDHYNDQAQMYADGELRDQLMNKEEIMEQAINVLNLKP